MEAKEDKVVVRTVSGKKYEIPTKSKEHSELFIDKVSNKMAICIAV